jgi:hypothetical protein
MYCQCQISHKRRKKECLGKFKFSLNRLKKQILRKQFLSVLQKEKLFSYNQTYYSVFSHKRTPSVARNLSTQERRPLNKVCPLNRSVRF